MNDFQSKLYNDLMNLCSNEAFYYVDQKVDGKVFRVFTYRLASYTEFCLPNALECRGHTFLMDGETAVDLVSMPPAKFFNAYENPFVMDLDFAKSLIYMDKMDGSLISSVKMHTDTSTFVLKSKTSFSSSQAQASQALLNTAPYHRLQRFIDEQTAKNRTVNMEYCAPDNRIVIGYLEPKLTILNIRDNETGETIYPHQMVMGDDAFEYVYKFIVAYYKRFDGHPHTTFDEILGMQGIEGYVVLFEDGRVCKVKTEAYCALHKTKDSINNPKALFQACLFEASDDLRSLFHDDVLAMTQIDAMEKLVRREYNHRSAQLQAFYDNNKHLDRKSYAILGQTELKEAGTFSLAMNLYLGKEAGLRDWMMKNYREFGINDVSSDETEN